MPAVERRCFRWFFNDCAAARTGRHAQFSCPGVTFGNDSGHPPESGGGAAFARNDEALVNYGYAHIKKAYDVMSLLAETAYDTAPERVYFLGGSTGGREGLTAATRWPESSDGVITYYPTAFFMGLRLWGVALADAIYSDDSAGWFPLEIVETIAERAVTLRDPLDGAEDGIVSNPAECRAISSSIVEDLRCPADQVAANCLNQTQIDRVIDVYYNGYTLPCEIGGWSEYKGYNSLEGVVMNIGTQAEYINPRRPAPMHTTLIGRSSSCPILSIHLKISIFWNSTSRSLANSTGGPHSIRRSIR
ncbi:MAG: hypothetical protein CML24_04110 [Rhizobiales bacterium]|nr:hypothetical protein [Hyphomicrobiales bacterium]